MGTPFTTSMVGRAAAARLVVAAAVGLLAGAARFAAAQPSWEYSPYRVRVWLAVEARPELPPGVRDRLERALVAQSEAVMRAAWELTVEAPPPALRPELLLRLDALDTEQIASAARPVLLDDKLFALAVGADDGGYWVRARELDCRTRSWSEAAERRTAWVEQLEPQALDALLEVFRPLARVEQADRRTATLRTRAGGLILAADNPAAIDVGDVLLPVIRQDDRSGEPRPNGIRRPPWTVLWVAERRGAVLECQVHSGLRSPLGGRIGSLTRRFGLVARPRREHTRLTLLSQDEPPRPLEGYEIWARDPVLEADDQPAPQLLGRTDWRGEIVVPRGPRPLRILYVKNGGRVLARLPIVPGWEAALTAQLPSDDLRLEAEAFIRGFQANVLDLVARRQLLAVRIRRRIKEGKLGEAQRLLDELRQLPTQAELSRLLNEQHDQMKTDDERLQERIDQLFLDTETLLAKYLNPSLANELVAELEKAR